jgi:hypothetical protein
MDHNLTNQNLISRWILGRTCSKRLNGTGNIVTISRLVALHNRFYPILLPSYLSILLATDATYLPR